jgi:aminobenzoyl-glutamate utilization protein B
MHIRSSKRNPVFLMKVAAVFLVLTVTGTAQVAHKETKERIVNSVETHRDELISLSDQVWEYAEIALREEKSAELLASYLEKQGFTVERGVAGMPTAFIAEYGSGAPVIGIMGEYDALPGLSQKVSPTKEPLEEGAAGHGCGHNLFGAASVGAAVAVKEAMESNRFAGTIRFYGTPAEEDIGGKIFMVKAGLFDDVDVALAWHPASRNEADIQSSQAIVDFKVEFFGKAAHAAFDPWNGRSALDGLDLLIHALNLMREHVRPTVRIHYVIQDGGRVPNIVPEHATLWCWIRDSKRDGVHSVLEWTRKAAEGAALATETTSTLTVNGGDYEVLPIREGGLLMFENMKWIGPIDYIEEDQSFARAMQRSAGVEETGMDGSIHEWRETAKDPEGGSTDVGDVSWVVPVVNLTAATAPAGVPWHSWAVVASSAHSIGHKGMIFAAKALGATAIDLFLDAEARGSVIDEFKKKTEGHTYQSFIPDDRAPRPRPQTKDKP